MTISLFRFDGSWYERNSDGETRRTDFSDLVRSDYVAVVLSILREAKIKLVQPHTAVRKGWTVNL